MPKTVCTRWPKVPTIPCLLLTADDLLMFQKRCTVRVRNYPAVKTLSLFIRQAISADKSCRNALIADAADQTALQNKRLKTRNDAYCKARKRIVESEVKSLFQLSGQRLDEAVRRLGSGMIVGWY